MNVYSKNIYEIYENNKKKHILIIYNISSKHYIGITVHSVNSNNFIYIKSINKYIDINELQEYTISNIKRIGIY